MFKASTALSITEREDDWQAGRKAEAELDASAWELEVEVSAHSHFLCLALTPQTSVLHLYFSEDGDYGSSFSPCGYWKGHVGATATSLVTGTEKGGEMLCEGQFEQPEAGAGWLLCRCRLLKLCSTTAEPRRRKGLEVHALTLAGGLSDALSAGEGLRQGGEG